MRNIGLRGTVAALSCVALGALAACGGPAAADELRGTAPYAPADPTEVPATEVEPVMIASEELGVHLMASAEPGANSVVSPASATIAFGMLAPGASGEGAEDMTRLLGADPDTAVRVVNAFVNRLSEWEGDPEGFDPEEIPDTPFLHIANRAVVDDEFEPKESYLDSLVTNFDAGVTQADLADPSTKAVFDEWVNHHTAGLIPESAMDPSDDLVLVLQNAVLFGAQWQQPFEEAQTTPRPFILGDGTSVDVDMMTQLAMAGYAEQDGWSAISLNYSEGLVALFFLPPAGTDPLEGDPAATASTLRELEGALAEAPPSSVQVTIPVIDTEAKTQILPVLSDLGYSAILQGTARPFDGIADAELFIGQATQQAILKVNEEGTVAAAVTEMGVGATSAPMVDHEFTADRPFIMTVVSPYYGWDLFQAAIRDPRN
ncbi:MAG: serpin family protein [bacterium]|nr:serpin family protein [bacterium]